MVRHPLTVTRKEFDFIITFILSWTGKLDWRRSLPFVFPTFAHEHLNVGWIYQKLQSARAHAHGPRHTLNVIQILRPKILPDSRGIFAVVDVMSTTVILSLFISTSARTSIKLATGSRTRGRVLRAIFFRSRATLHVLGCSYRNFSKTIRSSMTRFFFYSAILKIANLSFRDKTLIFCSFMQEEILSFSTLLLHSYT